MVYFSKTTKLDEWKGIHTVLTYVEGEEESKSEKHPKHVGDKNVYQGEYTHFTIGFGIHWSSS